MKKKLMLATLVAVLAPALWLGFGRQDDGPDYAFGMGQKLAGGWLLTGNVPNPVEVLVSLSVTTIGELSIVCPSYPFLRISAASVLTDRRAQLRLSVW